MKNGNYTERKMKKNFLIFTIFTAMFFAVGCHTPCDNNPCNNIANSTKICTFSEEEFKCGCERGYLWSGSMCIKTKTFSFATLGNICTGHNKCYNNEKEIECPNSSQNFFGQDAQYLKTGYCLPQSFTVKTVSGEKTVVDNNTGLEWEQTPTKLNWNDAKEYCENLTYAGNSDWRLPTPYELLTIVDNSRFNPSINLKFFPNTPSAYFWTSITSNVFIPKVVSIVNRKDFAWSVRFDEGRIREHSKDYDDTYARCVRGQTLPTGSFQSFNIKSDTVVIDTNTGLIWQKTYSIAKSWEDALSYCENLTYAGYSDWRLPNKNELASLVDYQWDKPASDFPDMSSKFHFISSSSLAQNNKEAWALKFDTGNIYAYDKSGKYVQHYFRCVRNDIHIQNNQNRLP